MNEYTEEEYESQYETAILPVQAIANTLLMLGLDKEIVADALKATAAEVRVISVQTEWW